MELRDYFKDRFVEIGNKLSNDKTRYDYMSMNKLKFKLNFDKAKPYFDPKVKYIQIDNILVGETVHSQYIYNTENPTKLVKEINYKIEKLKKTLADLESSKEKIIKDCTDVSIKRDLVIDYLNLNGE